MEYQIYSLKASDIIKKEYVQSIISINNSFECRLLKLKEKEVNLELVQVVFENKKEIYDLYKDGFDFKGRHYIKYKRSASQAKLGKCFFIEELTAKKNYFSETNNWGLTFDLAENKEKIKKDYLAFEAYKGLLFSSIENFFELSLDSILFVPDFINKSSTLDGVYSVFSDDNKSSDFDVANIKLKAETITINNNVFDGQALLDVSVFKSICNGQYKNSSMLLLRNNFFKACAFNTNLTMWFHDQGLYGKISKDENGKMNRLRGYTKAKNYEDIKLVITYSSLKYLKFFLEGNEKKAIDMWLKNTFNYFGIVKDDKPSNLFKGNGVYTNYQLLNTIDLKKEDLEKLVRPTFDLISSFYDQDEGVNNYLSYLAMHSSIDLDGNDIFNVKKVRNYENTYVLKKKAIERLLLHNVNFAKTSFYKEFLKSEVDGIIKRLRNGRILIKGTYAYLFANPLEFLKYIVNYDTSDESFNVMPNGSIISKAFDGFEELLCSRSPHIMMGNLYLTKNIFNYDVDIYFNLSKQIVCINLINENLASRLNGSDQDGDQILITNNRILIDGIKDYLYHAFFIPNNGFSKSVTNSKFDLAVIAAKENKIRNNNIGSIINLAQKYNSLFWDYYHQELANGIIEISKDSLNTKDGSKILEIYYRLCVLEVISNTEIDAAKGKYDIDSKKILKKIKDLDKAFNEKVKKLPKFFKYIQDDDFDYVKKGYINFECDEENINILGLSSDPNSLVLNESGNYTYIDKGKFDKKVNDDITIAIIKYKNSKGNIIYSGILSKKKKDYISIQKLKEMEANASEIYYLKGKIKSFLGENKYIKYDCPMDNLEEVIDEKIINSKAKKTRNISLLDELAVNKKTGGTANYKANEILEKLESITNELNRIRLLDSEYKKQETNRLLSDYVLVFGDSISSSVALSIIKRISGERMKNSMYLALYFISNNPDFKKIFKENKADISKSLDNIKNLIC